jgi:hypothetical protein
MKYFGFKTNLSADVLMQSIEKIKKWSRILIYFKNNFFLIYLQT